MGIREIVKRCDESLQEELRGLKEVDWVRIDDHLEKDILNMQGTGQTLCRIPTLERALSSLERQSMNFAMSDTPKPQSRENLKQLVEQGTYPTSKLVIAYMVGMYFSLLEKEITMASQKIISHSASEFNQEP